MAKQQRQKPLSEEEKERRSHSLDVEVSASGFTKELEEDAEVFHPAGPEEDDDEEDSDTEETVEDVETEEQSVDVADYNNAILELEGLKVSKTNGAKEEVAEKRKEDETNSDAKIIDETVNDLEEELEDAFPELSDLSALNKEFKPFRDPDSLLQMAEHRRTRADSEATVGSTGSCSTIPPELVRQKVRRQLTKQQKSAQRRRLQKGEASLVTKSRRENQNNIKSSLESATFWG